MKDKGDPVVRLSGRRQITYNVFRGLPNWISDNTYDGGLMNNAPIGGRGCRTRKSVDPSDQDGWDIRWLSKTNVLSLSLSFFSVSVVRVHGRRRRPPSAAGSGGRIRDPAGWRAANVPLIIYKDDREPE